MDDYFDDNPTVTLAEAQEHANDEQNPYQAWYIEVSIQRRGEQ